MGFFFVFILITLLLDVYIYQAVKAGFPSDGIHWTQVAFWILCSITYLSFLFFALLGKDGFHGYPRVIMMGISMSFMVLKLVTLPFLLISDLIRAFEWIATFFQSNDVVETGKAITRSRFLNRVGLIAGSAFFGAFIYGFVRGAYQIQTRRIKVKIKNLPAALRGLKIVQISDSHLGSFATNGLIEKAVSMINAEQADLFFFTGDMVNDKANEALPFKDILSKIKAKYGQYSILGNHDYGDYVEWNTQSEKEKNLIYLIDFQRSIGWDILLDEHRLLNIKGEQVAVLGVQYWGRSMGFGQKGKIEQAVMGTENAALKLLLSHDPSHWDYVISKDKTYSDIAITFSGHTHGFQFGIEIPGLKWSPSQWVYPHWAGLYKNEAQQYLYVNRGLGFLGYPGRVGIPPEITVMELI